MDIAGNEQVQLTVTVIVTKARAIRPVAEGHSSLLSNICERPITVVMKETVLSEITYIQIWPAVIVVVSHSHAVAPAAVGYAGLGSNIGKGAIVIVMEEGGVWRLSLAIHCFIGRTVHQVDIDPAIMVVVQQGHARAGCFQDVIFLRVPHLVMPDGQA